MNSLKGAPSSRLFLWEAEQQFVYSSYDVILGLLAGTRYNDAVHCFGVDLWQGGTMRLPCFSPVVLCRLLSFGRPCPTEATHRMHSLIHSLQGAKCL